jgi:hypothetical protein
MRQNHMADQDRHVQLSNGCFLYGKGRLGGCHVHGVGVNVSNGLGNNFIPDPKPRDKSVGWYCHFAAELVSKASKASSLCWS